MGQCVKGCFCKEGYVLNKQRKCVPTDECPEICGANEVWMNCGSACPRTCQNMYGPPSFCTDDCVEGCFCQRRYVRNEQTGECVSKKECPAQLKPTKGPKPPKGPV